MDIYLKQTRILDFNNLSIQKLIEEKDMEGIRRKP